MSKTTDAQWLIDEATGAVVGTIDGNGVECRDTFPSFAELNAWQAQGKVINSNAPIVVDGAVYVARNGSFSAIGGATSLVNTSYTNGKLTSWTDGGISYTATYRPDGKINTVTGGGVVKTWTYNSDGSVNRIDVGAA